MAEEKTSVTVRVKPQDRDYLNQIRGACVAAGLQVTNPDIVEYLFSLISASENEVVNHFRKEKK